MCTKPIHLAALLTSATLCTLAFSSAQAAVVTASANYYENGSLLETSSDESALVAQAGAAHTNGAANAYSDVNGILWASSSAGNAGGGGTPVATFFSFPAPDGAVSTTSTATWGNTFTNNTGQPIDYTFMFYISPPTIGTNGSAGDYAGLAIDITLDGDSIWSAFAEMDECELSYSGSLGAPGTTSGCEAGWGGFTTALALGNYVDGDSFTLGYEMSTFASVTDTSSAAFARVGDPFDVDGEPIQLLGKPASQVPEPASLGLGLLGLLAVAGVRHQRRGR